jgi:integrase
MNIRKRAWTWQGEKRTAWVLDSKDGTRRLRKQFATKQEAELYRDKLIRNHYAAEYGVLLESRFSDFLDIYEKKKAWKTDSYRERVMSALRLMPFDHFPNTEAIEKYRDERLKKSAPSTVRQDLAAIHDCLKWAVKLNYLRANPGKEVERPSLPVKQDDPAAYLSPEQFGDLLVKAKNDRPLYKFAVWTGLRITELLVLEWSDVRDGYVVVRRGKGRKQRIVPLLPQALAALKEVPRRLKDPRVFWWMKDRHTTLRRFQRRLVWAGLTKPGKKLDKTKTGEPELVAGFRFHDLRHTFGAYAAQSGVELEVIAAAMGHTSTTVTKLYAHLSPDYKRNELMKMAKMSTNGTRKAQRGQKPAKSGES